MFSACIVLDDRRTHARTHAVFGEYHISPSCTEGRYIYIYTSHFSYFGVTTHFRKTFARHGGTFHLCSPPAMLSQSLHESSPSAIKSPSFSTMSRRHVGTSSFGPVILKARICRSNLAVVLFVYILHTAVRITYDKKIYSMIYIYC